MNLAFFFKKFQYWPILARLFFGFSFLLVLILAVGTIAFNMIDRVSDSADRLYRHPFTVGTHIRDVKLAVQDIRAIARNLAETKEPQQFEEIRRTLEEKQRIIDHKMALIEERYLGPKHDVHVLYAALQQYERTRIEGMRRFQSGETDRGVEWVKTRGKEDFNRTIAAIDSIITFSNQRAEAFHQDAIKNADTIQNQLIVSLIVLVILGILCAWIISKSIVLPLRALASDIQAIAEGKTEIDVHELNNPSELGVMARSIEVFRQTTVQLLKDNAQKAFIQQHVSELQTAQAPIELLNRFIQRLAQQFECGQGVVYLKEEEVSKVRLVASYGYRERKHLGQTFEEGEGLIGQCLLEKMPITLTGVPENYRRITSGLGEAVPHTLVVLPLILKNQVLAIVELARFQRFTEEELNHLDALLPLVALQLEVLSRTERTERLLEESVQQTAVLQRLSEQLSQQSEALRQSNIELEEKSEQQSRLMSELQAAEEELRTQQEELETSNQELRENARILEERQEALENARSEANQKALEAAVASRYKSEFVANMSHELRTPLNSLLILAKMLAENGEGNLTPDQVESASIILESGSHLLHLINDILDISKVEAGRMEILPERLDFKTLAHSLERRFRALAKNKQLGFVVEVAPHLDTELISDAGKLEQILNNLVNNALKFTEKGSVRLTVRAPEQPTEKTLVGAQGIVLAVHDSGIGIPADKIDRLFHAFEQLDSSTSRRYGGTGLGLAISRKLAQLLGGDIVVTSTEGQGSTFALCLPRTPPGITATRLPRTTSAEWETSTTDEVSNVSLSLPGAADRLFTQRVLLVEDDPATSTAVKRLLQNKVEALVTLSRAEDAWLKLQEERFGCLILDLGLPGMSGLTFLERAKERGLLLPPIVVYTAQQLNDNELQRLREFTDSIVIKGAGVSGERLAEEVVLFLHRLSEKDQCQTPSDEPLILKDLAGHTVLIVDDDMRNAFALSKILRAQQMKVLLAQDGYKALTQLKEHPEVNIVLMDIMMPGMDGYETLQKIRALGDGYTALPMIALTAKAMPGDKEACLKAGANAYLPKPIETEALLQAMKSELTLYLGANPA